LNHQEPEPVTAEPRWPVILTVLLVVGLLAFLPQRIGVFPGWLPFVIGPMIVTPMFAIWLSGRSQAWLRIERMMTLCFAAAMCFGTISNVLNLIKTMIRRPDDVTGLELLASGASVWVLNVVAFSLIYWQIDRGGPETRRDDTIRPDFLFPQTGVPDEAPLRWHPTFLDYLSLGFSTATAFSTTEVAPLTSRAKLLMMLEALIALVTLVIIASRAINIIGTE
jgi:hypothetical protein